MHTDTPDTTADQPLRRIKDLPGPRPLPLIGNGHQIKPQRIHQHVERWSLQYGPLMRMYFGATPILVVADHEMVGAVLRDRPDGFRRPSISATISNEMGGIPGLFLAEGADWRNQRRMVMAGFAPTAIKAYFPALVAVALRLRRRWQAAASARKAIDLESDLKRYTVDIIAGLAFGSDVNTLESGEDVIQRHLDDILPAVARRSLALVPYWRYVKLPADRRLDRSVAVLRTAVQDLIGQARQRMLDNPARRERPPNLLEAMIAAADQSGSGVTDLNVAGNVTNMLLAGEDTTANTISWMIYLLQRHPHTLQKARDEVRRNAPDAARFTIEQLDSLDYLGACANEAMRLKPVAPYLPLEALRDTVIGDVAVPAGTMIWCVLRHDSVAEKHFPDPLLFDPQRWLQADGKPNSDKRVTMPFGAGLRTCPGRYLALLEIKIAMAMLLGSFDIAGVDTPDGKEAQELMGFVMSPVGLSLRLE
ncbi:cytochrome P450 [Janthinobacterium agaricidamnosum]|uniref:Cytochrome P450 family protein n=1 Tax=Janthinobacterium agaricidamnosum NBRC 102515 = DSM 9628 TaxID=1349767 RepID=W0VCF1_9BURK|nr:cytochrome P450 [Janthinobacterium agaricidamnosum]CDG85345.1 cytochrome P450 family protein [Janthinobacterium agaricidamnosum NBRC 102515 = DSM 9628]